MGKGVVHCKEDGWDAQTGGGEGLFYVRREKEGPGGMISEGWVGVCGRGLGYKASPTVVTRPLNRRSRMDLDGGRGKG